MNKELEAQCALGRIRLFYDLEVDEYSYIAGHDFEEDLNIIETALKDYEYQTKLLEKLTEPKIPTLTSEEIEQLKKSSGYITEYKGIYVDENTFKKLKALEIIKETGCSYEHISLIEETKNYEEYEAQFDNYLEKRYEPFKFEVEKSKEEYDLLKEVLK